MDGGQVKARGRGRPILSQVVAAAVVEVLEARLATPDALHEVLHLQFESKGRCSFSLPARHLEVLLTSLTAVPAGKFEKNPIEMTSMSSYGLGPNICSLTSSHTAPPVARHTVCTSQLSGL